MIDFWDFSNGHFYITIFLSLLNAVLLCFESNKFMQIIQLNGYHLHGYMSWLSNTRNKYALRVLFVAVLSLFGIMVTNVIFRIFGAPLKDYLSYLGLAFYGLFSVILIKVVNETPKKVPLKVTSRIKRSYVVLFILCALISFGLMVVSNMFVDLIRYGAIALTPLLLLILVPFSHFLLKPLEKGINRSYIKKAKIKLKNYQNLKVIAITGSYGKTTTKNALNTILSEKFSVCSSPLNYNTPLGLTKTILENLAPTNQILIAEMGARRTGDIKQLCELVNPQFGILTSIGQQHIQTFGSIENVKRTKAELPNYLGKNGFCVFNFDDESVCEISKNFQGEKFNISLCNKNCDIFANSIKVSENGTSFRLFFKEKYVDCKTKLLGIHNISNILLCVGMALKFGMSLEEIASGIEKIKPVEHRLQLVKAENDVLILDDTYNASIIGSGRALEVLNMFKNRRKIIVTPGIVELGQIERLANYELGKQISQVCDIVVIVNETNLLAIKQGLLDSNFGKKNIFEAENLSKAQELLKGIIKTGDVVLWENDLPDNYT